MRISKCWIMFAIASIVSTKAYSMEDEFSPYQTPSAPPNSPVEEYLQENNCESKIYKYETPKDHIRMTFKLPEKSTIITEASRTYKITEDFPKTNLISKFELCGNQNALHDPEAFMDQIANINLPVYSKHFLQNQLPLEDRLSSKKGGSQLLKQNNKLDTILEEDKFVIGLDAENDNMPSAEINDNENTQSHTPCKSCKDIADDEKQVEKTKTPFISISKSKSLLNRTFDKDRNINLTTQFDKISNLQLPYVGQCQNTTFYDTAKDTNKLFFDLLDQNSIDPSELDTLNWSTNSEENI